MNKIIILTDSSSNLNSSDRELFGVEEIIPMHYFLDGVMHDADGDWKEISYKDYYDAMRNGARAKSAQVNAAQYKEAFVKYLDKGYDVLSISCTSALSSSVKESFTARDELQPKYPDQKIRCIDSACCNYALALLIKDAAKLRDEGKDIDEIVEFIESVKLNYNEIGTVEKLTYLRAAGRVSASAAFFGGLFAVKPIIIYDTVGHNIAVAKVKGRRKSFEEIGDMVKKYADVTEHKTIYIAHADAIEDAEEVAEIIQSKYEEKLQIVFGVVEPVVGSSVGPGTLILGFYASKDMRVPLDKK